VLAAAAAAAPWDTQDTCDDPMKTGRLFVAHWTHVPKAGGTAFAGLAKRIACKMNPQLRDTNPCCVPDLCITTQTCEATAASCPFVVGIGKHESAMSKLVDMPCCGHEWYASTGFYFARFALRMRSYARSLAAWPLEARVKFFAASGLERDKIDDLLSAGVNVARREELMRVFDAAEPLYPVARQGGTQSLPFYMRTCHRAAHGVWPVGLDHFADESSPAEARAARPCCARRRPGSTSMTMLRQPFVRSASAFYYQGHSPNLDNYDLRPHLFRSTRRFKQLVPRRFSFDDFIGFDEYRNVLTTLFGDSSACPATAACQAGKGYPGCALTYTCHAYRNNSAYLDETHLATAKAALDRHAFVGFTEAYDTSVRLLLHTFGLEPDERSFQKVRGSADCRSRVLRLDAAACRRHFALNAHDNALYEYAHREFCGRLSAAGLRRRDDVRAELRAADLCGATDFSDEEDVCGRLETAEARARLEEARRKCAANGVTREFGRQLNK